MQRKVLYVGSDAYKSLFEAIKAEINVKCVSYEFYYKLEESYNLYIFEDAVGLREAISSVSSFLLQKKIIISNKATEDEQVLLVKELDTYNVSDIIFMPISQALFQLKLNSYSQESVYKTFIDKMSPMAMITDINHKILYVNNAFKKETGYDSEILNDKPNLLKSGKQSLMFYNNIAMTIHAGMPWEGRFKNLRKDGSLYTEDASIVPIEANGNHFFGKTSVNTTNYEILASENERSIKLASAIQQSLIAEDIYDQNITIKSLYRPLVNVSGDIYNLYKISDEIYCVFLADVVGHGVASALFTTSIIAITNDLVKEGYMPDVFLKKLNDKVIRLFNKKDLSDVNYFTAGYIVIDTKNKKIHYANCGHPHFYYVHENTFKVLQEINFAIGMFQGVVFDYGSCAYEPNSEILLYTDGLVEMEGAIKEGREAVESILRTYESDHKQAGLIEQIEKQLIRPNEQAISDDITLIEIKLIED